MLLSIFPSNNLMTNNIFSWFFFLHRLWTCKTNTGCIAHYCRLFLHCSETVNAFRIMHYCASQISQQTYDVCTRPDLQIPGPWLPIDLQWQLTNKNKHIIIPAVVWNNLRSGLDELVSNWHLIQHKI